eukprot:4484879-Pyramimonas_sp.AAC.1
MSAGHDGRMPPTHVVQLIGILPKRYCRCNRVGKIWVNPLYFRDNNQPCQGGNISIEEMYEYRKDASSLKDWFIPETPYNLKCPDPAAIQAVEFTAVLLTQG